MLLLGSCLHPFVTAQQAPAENARRVVTRTLPVYPELARRMNLAVTVRLRVTVSPEGSVKSTEVVGGNPVLAKAAQDAVANWKWTAAPQETKELVELSFQPR